MPLSASAWLVASGWIERDHVRLHDHVLLLPQHGQDLVLDEGERLGHVLPADVPAHERDDARSAPPPRAAGGAPPPRRRPPRPTTSGTPDATPRIPSHPLRPILALMMPLLAVLFSAQAAAAPFPAPDCSVVPGWTQQGPERSYDTETLFDYMNGNSEGYFAYGFTLMKGVTCVNAGGRPARDRRFGDGRPGPRVGLLRHEPRPALARRDDRLRRPGAPAAGHLREGPPLRRDRGEPGQGPPRGAAGVRDRPRGAESPARAACRTRSPGSRPRASSRTRSGSCRRASSGCAC